MIRAIVLTGSPGAGKSSVLQALAGLLDNDKVPHAAIESEQLAWGYPWLPEEQAYAVLAEVCRVQRGFGRRLFLIAATTETDEHITGLLAAIAADQHTVVCLEARPETAARRVHEREPAEWHGRDRLVAAARRLAIEIPALKGVDLHVRTEGRAPREVAREIIDLTFSEPGTFAAQ
jgi:broad-specificity NMP kinase